MKKDLFGTSLSTKESNERIQLEEGVDYYFENGLMVFTSHFLLKRGYCCENGCRHCPYTENEFQVSSSKFQVKG
jgi:hypothetical protein